MNEKLLELAKQCSDERLIEYDGGGEYVEVFDKEKFAKLIIEESMTRLKEEGNLAEIQAFVGSTYKYGYMYQAADIIKQHFGV